MKLGWDDSDQRSVGSSPGRGTGVLEQDASPNGFVLRM